MEIGLPTAAHFIYIPVVLILGIVIGWMLGSRAAQDAFAMELKKREAKSARRHAAGAAVESHESGVRNRTSS